MEKVKTMQEAYRVFELLGIKEVTKPWQKAKGTEVWELPQKTMYYNGHASINRFSIYRSGYVRKMVVYGENNASMSCYQLNRVRKEAEYFKDYEWVDLENDNYTQKWTGKYRKRYASKRILIDNHRDRVVYLCNYILKNYYRNGKMNLVGEYTMKRVAEVHGEWWRNKRFDDEWPFEDVKRNGVKEFDGDEHELTLEHFKKIPRESFTNVDDIRVIINGHRYKLR